LSEVDDDDVFIELLKEEKELWLLVEDESDPKNIQVFMQTAKEPLKLTANSLDDLREKSNIIY
jgi:hypothetical protein